MIEHVNFMKHFTTYPIPAHISNEMTTTEMFMNWETRINDIIDSLNQYDSNMTEYTDKKVAELLEYIDSTAISFKEELDKFKFSTNLEFATFKEVFSKEVDSKLLELKTEIENKIQAGDLANEQECKRRYDELLGMIRKYGMEILNPVTGDYADIETVINSIYDAFRNDAITCSDFDSLITTALSFDTAMTNSSSANYFDVQGKTFMQTI